MENIINEEKLRNAELEGELLLLQQMFLVVKKLNCVLKKDGNQWCYVYNELPDPDYIAGFGNSPRDALNDFYNAWRSVK